MSQYDLFETPSGNAVVVALDHGLSLGAVEGFKNPETTLQAVLDGQPDGVLVSAHFARHFGDVIADAGTDLLITIDCVTFSTKPGMDDGADIWTSILDRDLLYDLDPAGVKVVLVFGREDRDLFQRNISFVTEMAAELRGSSIPLIIEPVMWGRGIPEPRETDPEYVERASRMAWEYGADVLKVPYTGSPSSFEPVAANAPVPVMILGGPSGGGVRSTLEAVHGAVSAGARGLVIGRRIWQTEDPTAVITAMNGIVHEDKTVAEVWD